MFELCIICDATNCTLISRDDAFSQRQAARLLLLPTASSPLHLQQVWRYPKRVETLLTLAVLPTPKTYIEILISTVMCEVNVRQLILNTENYVLTNADYNHLYVFVLQK